MYYSILSDILRSAQQEKKIEKNLRRTNWQYLHSAGAPHQGDSKDFYDFISLIMITNCKPNISSLISIFRIQLHIIERLLLTRSNRGMRKLLLYRLINHLAYIPRRSFFPCPPQILGLRPVLSIPSQRSLITNPRSLRIFIFVRHLYIMSSICRML